MYCRSLSLAHSHTYTQSIFYFGDKQNGVWSSNWNAKNSLSRIER